VLSQQTNSGCKFLMEFSDSIIIILKGGDTKHKTRDADDDADNINNNGAGCDGVSARRLV